MRTRHRTDTLRSLIALLLAVAVTACGDPAGPDGRFSEEAIDFYVEVALGTEFGSTSPLVRKWTDDVLVRVDGDPAPVDLTELDRVIDELNQLRGGARIRLVGEAQSSNIAIHFAPQATFGEILPQYVPGNRGFFWFWFNSRNEITSAIIMIDNTDDISQMFRNHLIREELTQVLGLANDSPRFPGSIFHSGSFPAPTEYAPIDREVITIHGLPEIRPGMTETDVRRTLSN